MKLATRSEGFGCLFGLLGSLLGAGIGLASFGRYAAEIRARHPDAEICGNGAMAGLMGGFMLGGLSGMILGVVLHYAFPADGQK